MKIKLALATGLCLFLLKPQEVNADNKVSEPEAEQDFLNFPLCGDKPMYVKKTCRCGNVTLSGYNYLSGGDQYCCVPPSSDAQCQYTGPGRKGDLRYSDVRCPNGEPKLKTQPCFKQCWNQYTKSKKLYLTATLYCQKEDICLPL